MTDSEANAAAQRIAQQYGLEPRTVAHWMKQGFSRAQIERACRMGEQFEADPGDILAMLEAGFDWRQIQKALDTVPDTDTGEEEYE
jgi:hypothetical protein